EPQLPVQADGLAIARLDGQAHVPHADVRQLAQRADRQHAAVASALELRPHTEGEQPGAATVESRDTQRVATQPIAVRGHEPPSAVHVEVLAQHEVRVREVREHRGVQLLEVPEIRRFGRSDVDVLVDDLTEADHRRPPRVPSSTGSVSWSYW